MSIEHPKIGEIRRGHEIGKTNSSSKNRFIWQFCQRCHLPRWVHYEKGKPDSIYCRKCAYIIMGENNILPDKPRLPANHIPKEGEIRTTTELGISTTWLGYWIWRICPDCNKGKWIRCNNNKPVSTRCFKCAIKHKTLLHNSRYPTPLQIEQYKPQIGDIRYA